MKRLLLPAVLTFLAGGAFGFLLGRGSVSTAPPLSADLAAYAQGLRVALGLDREQVADLRALLAYYDRERQRLIGAERATLEPSFADLDRRFEALIREYVLRPAQREQAGELERPVLPLSAAPPDR